MKIEIFNDVTYCIGKNAQENWDILDELKKENQNYVWFHLNSFPSCYVIMKCSLEELNEAYQKTLHLVHGAELCKENSKYRDYSNLKIVYTTLKKLTKTDKVGEVIISGKRNLITL
jgi:hypothetical protein